MVPHHPNGDKLSASMFNVGDARNVLKFVQLHRTPPTHTHESHEGVDGGFWWAGSTRSGMLLVCSRGCGKLDVFVRYKLDNMLLTIFNKKQEFFLI